MVASLKAGFCALWWIVGEPHTMEKHRVRVDILLNEEGIRRICSAKTHIRHTCTYACTLYKCLLKYKWRERKRPGKEQTFC